MKRTTIVLSIAWMIVALSGCQRDEGEQQPAATGTEMPLVEITVTAAAVEPDTSKATLAVQATPAPASLTAEDEVATYGYTHQRPDGNRLIAGQGAMPEARVIDIPLAGRPVWLVGAPVPSDEADGAAAGEAASVWAVVLDDGRVQAFIVQGEQIEETDIEPGTVQSSPPLLRVGEGRIELLQPPSPAFGPAPPAVLDQEGGLAVVSPEGELTVVDGEGRVLGTAESEPLPDGRLLVDEEGRLLFLSEPTTRYDHGIAGDAIEAAAVTLFDPQGNGGAEVIISVPEPAVIEGIMPLWADLNGGGRREIIVTQSDAQNGAQIVVYDESGEWIAAGPAIGLGRRWRHQLAVGPFGPNGEVELVDVLTPHIGGVVEFYQLVGDELQIAAKAPGYTSHVIGSRNLDMALAGDLDGDGRIEMLLPNQGRSALGAIGRTAGGAEVIWSVPLDGILSSNLVGVQLADAGLVVGAGREDGTLRLWLP